MREHTRANERYFRTEAGTLTLDWGAYGTDYSSLDFTYVLKGKAGNLSKIYGQVRRGGDGTYESYDTRAGCRRIKTSGHKKVRDAIAAHIGAVSGAEVDPAGLSFKMPIVPDGVKGAIGEGE